MAQMSEPRDLFLHELGDVLHAADRQRPSAAKPRTAAE